MILCMIVYDPVCARVYARMYDLVYDHEYGRVCVCSFVRMI